MIDMAKYRKKPLEVDAEQFFPDGKSPLPFSEHGACCFDGKRWYVKTAGAKAQIFPGDWIIAEFDNQGFYPCRPDIFEATYEPVRAGEEL